MVRRERIANDAESTLAASINTSATAVVLINGSSFPTEGDFRVVIDNEIMLVTARSGNTLTVVRGIENTVATNHSMDAPVINLLTKAVLEALIRESVDTFAFSRPPYRIQDTNGNLLTKADFTEITTTNATISDNADGSITVQFLAPDATVRLVRLERNAPSTPYIITAAVRMTGVSATAQDGPVFGIHFRETVNDETLVIRHRPFDALGSRLGVDKYIAEAFDSSLITLLRSEPSPSATVWLQIEDDGTNIYFRLSTDGVNFLEFHNELRGASFTGAGPDRVGWFVINADVTAHDVYVSLVAWDGE